MCCARSSRRLLYKQKQQVVLSNLLFLFKVSYPRELNPKPIAYEAIALPIELG